MSGPMSASPRRARRLVASAAVLLACVGAGANSASAHIDPDPPTAPAGSRQVLGFTVEHGCGSSPTVQVDMRLPENVLDALPIAPSGWSATIDGDVITWKGGPLASDVEGRFEVNMLLPLTPGETLYFPMVQRCTEGEIRWIGIDDGTSPPSDEPAPALELTDALPGTTRPPAPTSSTAAPTTTTVAVSTTASTVAPTVATDPSESTDVTAAPSASGGGGGGSGSTGIVAALAVVALGGVGYVVMHRRRAS